MCGLYSISVDSHDLGGAPYIRAGGALTLSLDGGGVDRVVGVSAQEVGAQQVLAGAAGRPGQLGRVQVEGLPRLRRKLGAAAVSNWHVVSILR